MRGVLTRRVIPCLDTRDGRVVKGRKFVGLRDIGEPAELAQRYDAEGADEIVLLDIAATPSGRAHALDVVRSIRERLTIPLTVGGGVRSIADAEALLQSGADKVAVNSAAVATPDLLSRLADRFGCQCITLALDASRDAAGGWQVFVRSGATPTTRGAIEWAQAAAELGAGEILLTSIDRDGTREGFDLELLREVSSRVHVPVVASGGARTPADLADAIDAGADAVLAASMFHDGEYTITETKRYLSARGLEIRQ